MAAHLTDKQFQRSRVRFYHQATHEVESGWIHKMTADWVWVISDLKAPAEVGQSFAIQVFGSTTDAIFVGICDELVPTAAKVNSAQAQMVLFRVASTPAFRPAERSARR